MRAYFFMDKSQAKEQLQLLIKKYEQVRDGGHIKSYREEETKKDFIMPLFEALGWDMRDKKEVSAEEYISGDRADYGFYVNNRIKFYLEAKSLKADLHREDFANQTINYSWNKGATWAVLTNFESLIIFNAQDIERSLGDKRYFSITYNKYLERFDDLWLLSREAFENDLIDIEAERVGKKFQKIPITAILSKDLNKCREILTESLSEWNDIKGELLDEGVQRLLDRLIFLRVAEDRGIEPPTLIPLVREWEASRNKNEVPLYKSMVKKFRELAETYDSNLFSKHPFEDWEEYGGATEKVIRILYGKAGYYEYDFKLMPADVLGSVYENYLGYKLSKSKKETEISKDSKKRKEQGIYYTPHFIVDYIVENALRPVLDRCRSLDDLKRVKVVDPACGSGSFLIKALDMIYTKYQDFGDRGRAVFTKIQILTDNIYGVDLDAQAVEIARLNLLISALDEKMKLPSLANNIKNGNSLISGTDRELEKYFGKKWRDKKPFNWQEEFPEAFKQGGFDVIIGNPPYVNLANIKDAGERGYLKSEFKTAKNKSDLYSFFTEKAINLLKENGSLGFIFSNSWLGTDSFSKFRKFLIENTKIETLVKLPPAVFEGATVTTVLIFLKKEKIDNRHEIKLQEYSNGNFVEIGRVSYLEISKNPDYNISFQNNIRFRIPTSQLVEIAKLSMGIKTSDNDTFILDEKKDNDCYRLLRGKDVDRYSLSYKGKWIWYKPELMMKKVGAGPRKLEYFITPKLLFREITGGGIIATFDSENYFTNNKIHILYFVNNFDLKFILALINSRLINFWVRSAFNNSFQVEINQLEKIPIPKLDLLKKDVKEKHDNLVRLANGMLQLNKELHGEEEGSNKYEELKSEIEKTDHKIDEEVYKLYDLTEDEIKIVEDNK